VEVPPMSAQPELVVDEDLEFVLAFLPPGWEAKAKELGALRRCRKIPDARVLLRVLLIHLAEGCSLRETAARAKHGGLLAVSDVTIMDRLRCSGEWFRWMSSELMSRWVTRQPQGVFEGPWNVRVVDGTQVTEPGPTGSSWRIHYAVGLPSLRCSELHLTDSVGSGSAETFCRFEVMPGDLFLGDRAYGMAAGIAHVANNGGDVLTRFGWSNLPLWADSRQRFDLFAHLRTLRGTALGDWPAYIKDGEKLIAGRVCAVRRSRQAAEEAQRRARRSAQKHSAQIEPQTLEAAECIFVFTTVSAQLLSPARALEFYRGRWQVELVFKRLKSILGLGHLRKTDEQAACSWLHGKLFVACLLEALLGYGEALFPWGYPLCETQGPQPLPVARGSLAAASAAADGQPAPGPAGMP
jgi:hypothetical protein